MKRKLFLWRRAGRSVSRLLLATLVWAALVSSGWAGTINVFLVGGQSNADGRANAAEASPVLRCQLDVTYYSNSAGGKLTYLQPWNTANGEGVYQFGPELSFGRAMADYYAAKGEKVALLKYAIGGTNLYEQWNADGTADSAQDGKIYKDFQNSVQKWLADLKKQHPADEILIRGMIWMQGEGDTDTKQNDAVNGKYSLEYAVNLERFIGDLRATFDPGLLFVIGKLSDKQTGTGPEIYRNNVRKCQEEVAAKDPLTGLVSTDACTLKGDKVHFDAEGQIAMGNSFAVEMQSLLSRGNKK